MAHIVNAYFGRDTQGLLHPAQGAVAAAAHQLEGEPAHPVQDFHEGDDGYAREQAEGASDGWDHVEHVGPQFQIDLRDDRRVEEEVHHRNVGVESTARQTRPVAFAVRQ